MQDMVIPPAEQVLMAARAHAAVVKINGSHRLARGDDIAIRAGRRASKASGAVFFAPKMRPLPGATPATPRRRRWRPWVA
jgi:hypothetical protein